MARTIRVDVDVQGSSDVRKLTVQQFLLVQRMAWHHSFQITYRLAQLEGEGNFSLSESKKLIGKAITITIKEEGKDATNKFEGVITEVSLASMASETEDLVLRGESPTILLDDGIHNRSFTNKTLGQIAEEVARPYAKPLVKTTLSPAYKTTLPYFVQYKESNYHFLRRLAAFYGEWFYYDGTHICLGKPQGGAAVALKYGTNLSDFDLALKLVNANFKLTAYQYLKNEVFQSKAAEANISRTDEYGKFVLDQSRDFDKQANQYPAEVAIGTKEELDQLTARRKKGIAGDSVVARGISDQPDLKVGSVIEVSSAKGAKVGSYLVTTISHSLHAGGYYQNQFEAVPSDLELPPLLAVPQPVCENQPAVVVQNDDPEGLGRVQVRFHWQAAPEKTPWIRVLSTHSGSERGFYFVPEVNEEVLVGFENDNPNCPVVQGSLYHGKASPKKWHDKDNNRKVIRTRSGNEISFNDQAGKEEIRIINKDAGNEIYLSLESEGKIRIKTKGKLEFQAKSISMEAQEGIQIKSGKGTELEAQEVRMKASNGTHIEAQQVQVQASQSFKLEGQQVKIDATTTSITSSAQLEIDGGGQSSLKSKMLQIDGGALASVKAGLIKLN